MSTASQTDDRPSEDHDPTVQSGIQSLRQVVAYAVQAHESVLSELPRANALSGEIALRDALLPELLSGELRVEGSARFLEAALSQ